jgi:TatD DNase family protein
MELFDTHCHVQSIGGLVGEESTRALWAKAKEQDPDVVVQRARDAGVTRLVCVGCTVEDSKSAVAFVSGRELCWASIGIHPHEAYHYTDDAAARRELAALAGKPKVVAVGECGLDYFYEHSPKKAQVSLLRLQIELALAHNLPIIFHVREAFDDFWPIFESYQSASQPIRGVLHSFTDTQANLERAIKHNLYVGVNGIATFTKNPMQQALYRTLPLEHLLLETDAPFLTPIPERGKICEPYHIRTIAEFLSQQRHESLQTIAEATTRNARQLFGT